MHMFVVRALGMYISFNKEDQEIVRKLAEERYGGKKGAITDVLRDGVRLLAQKEQEEAEHQKRIKRLRAFMDKGFNMGLGNRKAYEKRDDIYEGARGGR